ncbi:MAG: hypothetical protein GC162_02930 [Planctomycetes bacterium]|nr:hypothetical protein [Planctomycetota bacterium]
MQIRPIDNLNTAQLQAAAQNDAAGRFGEMLNAHASRDQQVRDAATEMVSMALVLPMLKMARNDPFKSDLFHGGQGEDAFGAQLDQIRAQQVAGSVSTNLVEAVYRQFGGKIAAAAGAAGKGVDRHG